MTSNITRVIFYLSLFTNLALIGAFVSTYIHNDYFRLWMDTMFPSVINIVSIVSATVGLFTGIGFFYERIKSNSTPRMSRLGHLTPLDILSLENPSLVTGGNEEKTRQAP